MYILKMVSPKIRSFMTLYELPCQFVVEYGCKLQLQRHGRLQKDGCLSKLQSSAPDTLGKDEQESQRGNMGGCQNDGLFLGP